MRILEFVQWEGNWGDESYIEKEDSVWPHKKQLLEKEQLLGSCVLTQCFGTFTFHPESKDLAEHLGHAVENLERSCSRSRINLALE